MLQEAGGIVVQLETKLSEHQKLDAKAQSNINSKKDSVKAEQKKLTQTKKQITSVSFVVKKHQQGVTN